MLLVLDVALIPEKHNSSDKCCLCEQESKRLYQFHVFPSGLSALTQSSDLEVMFDTLLILPVES